MQTTRSRKEHNDRTNRTALGRVFLTLFALMAFVSPLMPAAAAQVPPPTTTPTHNYVVMSSASCLNSSSAETNLSLTMHNIFIVMAGIGGALVVIALVFWGITHSTTSVFEDSSAEQKMKRRKQLFDILIGGLVILMAATIWAVIAGTVVGAPC